MAIRGVVSRMTSLRYEYCGVHLHEQMAPCGQAGPGCGKRRGSTMG